MDKSVITNFFKGNYGRFYNAFLPDLKKATANEFKGRCPFHDDDDPSLSINVDTGLFNCFGCGASGSIFDFYGRRNGMDPRHDLPKIILAIADQFGIHNGNGPVQTANTKSKIVARYGYRDQSGQVAYQIERLEPKSFRIKRSDGNGGWIYGQGDVEIIPYRFPDVIKSDEIIIVEGEKDADNLSALGFTATTNPFGAGKWPGHFGEHFKGKNIIIIPDNDAPGRDHMKKVIVNLRDHAASIKYLELPGLLDKGDVSDFIAKFPIKDDAAERLAVMIDGAPIYQAGNKDEERNAFHFRHANELIQAFSKVEWVIKNYLEKNTMMMLFADPGNFKTFVILSMAYSVAAGMSWYGNLIKESGTVFYICGEGRSGLARRLRALELHHGIPIKDIPLFVSSQAAAFLDQDGAATVVSAIDKLIEAHGKPVLIIVDTLSRNFGDGDENATKDMSRFIYKLDTDLRDRYEASIAIVHHTGLSAKDRGRGSGAMKGALEFEYLITKNQNDTRTMRATKSKDHADPPAITFRAEEIELPGWFDEDTGELLTSLVMVQTADTGQTNADGVQLSGQKKIAFGLLKQLVDERKKVMGPMDMNRVSIHVDEWREACYRGGISSGGADAKQKAVNRAITDLLNMNVINTLDDYYWLNNEK